ncbi:MAG: hypothetical protein PHN99_04175 [Eubacteriales bacterium]|nr:hypothetical protein [Eubacteriales bacterium]
MRLFKTSSAGKGNHSGSVHSNCRGYDHEKERCRKEAEKKCECAKQYLCNLYGTVSIR